MGSHKSTSRSQLVPTPSRDTAVFCGCLSSRRYIMSDDEEYDSEEEEDESDQHTKGPKNELEAKVVLTGEALEKKLKVWIGEWRAVRSKEDAELTRLKDKQEKRKVVRNEENKKLEEKQAIEEKRRQKEVEDKKKAENEEKMKKLEEAEKRRQAILKAEAEKAKSGANYLIQKKAEDTKADPAAEFKKTKEQLAEEKKVALVI